MIYPSSKSIIIMRLGEVDEVEEQGEEKGE